MQLFININNRDRDKGPVAVASKTLLLQEFLLYFGAIHFENGSQSKKS